MAFKLGWFPKRRVIIASVWPSIAVLMVAIALTACTRRAGWLSVGGAIITALGTLLWAHRLFRLKPAAADDPLPPATFPAEPGARFVEFNVAHHNERMMRQLDNYRGYIGVLLSIAGGIIGSVGPFMAGLIWDLK